MIFALNQQSICLTFNLNMKELLMQVSVVKIHSCQRNDYQNCSILSIETVLIQVCSLAGILIGIRFSRPLMSDTFCLLFFCVSHFLECKTQEEDKPVCVHTHAKNSSFNYYFYECKVALGKMLQYQQKLEGCSKSCFILGRFEMGICAFSILFHNSSNQGKEEL